MVLTSRAPTKTLSLLHIHVDNGLLVGPNHDELLKILDIIKKYYNMKDQETPTHHLGYCLNWQGDGSLCQPVDILEKSLIPRANSVLIPLMRKTLIYPLTGYSSELKDKSS